MHTVKVLGPGCHNCERLTALTEEALVNLDRPEQVEKITDYREITAYGVMSTPALIVDDQVLMAGRIPALLTLEEILGDRLSDQSEGQR